MTSYTVTGTTSYRGFAPGETFDAELTEDEERRAVERGSISVGAESTETSTQEEAGSDE